jgi:DNA-binding transcriptional MocR family regulator
MRCSPGPAARNAYVIEDDYDGGEQLQRRPIAAPAGLDADGTEIYCRDLGPFPATT